MLDFRVIKNQAKKYRSAVWFDNLLNSKRRSVLNKFFVLFIFLLIVFILIKSNFFNWEKIKTIQDFDWKNTESFNFGNFVNFDSLFYFLKDSDLVAGLALLFLTFFVLLKMFRSYLFSIIFSHKNVGFELAKVLLSDKFDEDSTTVFLRSNFGREVSKRVFLSQEKIDEFLNQKEKNSFFLFPDEFVFHKNEIEIEYLESEINIVDYVDALCNADRSLDKFLLKNKIKRNDFVQAASWNYRRHFNYRNKKRWWSRDRLAAWGQFGVALSYGQTFVLDKQTWGIESYHSIFSNNAYETYKADIEKMEIALIKQSRSNIFLVSESNTIAMEILKTFSKRIKAGKSSNALQNSRIRILSAVMFLENSGKNFQNNFIRLLNEAAESGNTILVFEDFFPFYEAAKIRGIDVLALIKPYFGSSLSFVILSNKGVYESFLQTNSYLKEYFETILSYQDTSEGLLFMVQDKILQLEKRNKVIFSFPALRYLVESTFRFFGNKSAPETFLKLLTDLLIFEKLNNKQNIDILETKKFIENKTGIPQVIENKKVLLNLEDKMHERIIGQNDAISSIADAIRRHRAGLTDKRKPVASFLFIGPTGVGKTETAKVLLGTYFSDHHKLIRFDMSEYSTPEAVAEFIGSTYTKKQGALSKVINANPYSLILFDELEKANREIHDLFLQILDEGQIVDAFGTKLNFKNSIIIATSNAGSDLMYQDEFNQRPAEEKRKTIIDYIIDNKIFRPEFLNRFDKVILFNRLTKDEMKQIAGLQLKYLVKKLRLESYDFVVTESLKEYLAEIGGVSNFGARETKRIIKDNLESLISRAILEEKIVAGDKFSIDVVALGENKTLEVNKIS